MHFFYVCIGLYLFVPALLNIYPVEWRLQRPSIGGFHQDIEDVERTEFNWGLSR